MSNEIGRILDIRLRFRNESKSRFYDRLFTKISNP